MHRLLRFTLALLASSCVLALRASDFAVIAHPAVTETSLSADDFSNILLGKRTSWSSGPVKLAVLGEGPVHEAVLKAHAQRSADQFDKHWKKLVFTGKGVLPVVCKTDSEVLEFVAKTPGSLGYVSAGAATAAVKVITVP